MSISNSINHVNFKFILPCRFQNPTVLSTSNFSSPFKFELLQLGQVNFNSFLQYNLFLLSAKWLVRIQEQLVPANSLLLSAKWLVRIQEQLVPVNLPFVFGQAASSHPRNSLYPYLCCQPSD